MPVVQSSYKNIPTQTLQAIRANQYRSADARREYEPTEIDYVLECRATRSVDDLTRDSEIRERERYELQSFIRRILDNRHYLSASTLQAIADDLATTVEEYRQ